MPPFLVAFAAIALSLAATAGPGLVAPAGAQMPEGTP